MILYNYGGAYLSHLYPFLNAGLYVLAVTDSGGADVIITVATHIQP
jgi:hypothetical protein